MASSSCLTPADSVGWVPPQASAARPKCRSRAKARRNSSLSIKVVAPAERRLRPRTVDRRSQSIDGNWGLVFNQRHAFFWLEKDSNMDARTDDRGLGRRNRPRKTPKGRQVEPQALAQVRALLGDRERRRDLLIEHLHLIQDRYGYLSAAHLAALAQEMKLAQTEVYEVATFYANFDVVKEDEPPPPALTVRVCDSLSCAMAGAEHLLRTLPNRLGTDVRVVPAPCMGACDRAPVCAVGHVQVMGATTENVAAAVAQGTHAHAYPTPNDFERYVRAGGYALLKACVKGARTRDDIIKAVSDAGLRGAGRLVRPSDAREDRRDALLGARHRGEGRAMVHLARTARAQGAAQLLGVGPGQEAGRRARARRRQRARADRRVLRRHAGGPPLQGLSARRRLRRHSAGSDGGPAARLRDAGTIRLLRGVARGCRSLRQGRYESGGAQPDALLRGRELRPMHALPGRHREGRHADGNPALGPGVVDGALRRHARRLDLRARPGGAQPAAVRAEIFPGGAGEAARGLVMKMNGRPMVRDAGLRPAPHHEAELEPRREVSSSPHPEERVRSVSSASADRRARVSKDEGAGEE